ncbi:MAG: hypothetical protein JWN72_460, partial [Thermoleophilia bacterium]|nr:hypothetical protein [Thermoleophilia bacterium]
MITTATPVATPAAAKPAATAPPKQWSSPPAMTLDPTKGY